MADALGVLTVVDKKRRIYFIENVKFHLDEVKGLGAFVEIEALGKEMSATPKELEAQCRRYMALLNIAPADWVDHSYSDLMLNSSVR